MRSPRQRAALLSAGLAATLADGGLIISPTVASAAAATRYEAETAPATCDGLIESNHDGYSGTGFCNGDNEVGAAAQFTVSAGTGGDTRLLTASDVFVPNGSKATPSLSGDILGDWREEVIWPTTDQSRLRIYSTPHRTGLRLTTLLHDAQYRVALAWQNTAYNQPPHPSFFLGNGMSTPPQPDIYVR